MADNTALKDYIELDRERLSRTAVEIRETSRRTEQLTDRISMSNKEWLAWLDEHPDITQECQAYGRERRRTIWERLIPMSGDMPCVARVQPEPVVDK